MDVRIFLLIIAGDGIDDRSRLLRCGGVIEIDQLFSTNVPSEDREIAANSFDIENRTVRR
jgi:hypothetical protein